MAFLICNDVVLSYGSKTVAENISFKIESGDFLCIVGQNGSGKSTLMKAILGLLPVSSGSIEFEPGFKRTQIGYLPQQTALQRDFPASVFEVVLSGCQNDMGLLPFYRKSHKKKADAVLERLNISGLKKQCFKNLSGGQQQRVLLARALCAAKSVILLDEPTAALDPVATTEFYSLLHSLNSEDKMTVIMISHDISQAIANANYVLHIDSNQNYFGTTQDYLKTAFGKLYAGEPQYE